jgi:hypothetical protein
VQKGAQDPTTFNGDELLVRFDPSPVHDNHQKGMTAMTLNLEFFVSWLPGVENQIPVTPTIDRDEEDDEA